MSISGVWDRSRMGSYGEIAAGSFVSGVTHIMAGYGRYHYFGANGSNVPRMYVVMRDPCVLMSACVGVMLLRSGFVGLMA